MQLGLLKRQAMHLTKGIEIKTDGSSEHQDLKVGMFSVIQWFKVSWVQSAALSVCL